MTQMIFVKKRQLAEVTGLSPETFKRYRLQGVWQKNIHWQQVNSRCTVYNLPLILDWFAHRGDPDAHNRAIETYLSSLPSNQPKKRGRRAANV